MQTSKKVLDDLLVNLFNHILTLEENNLKRKHIRLTMNEVHFLDAVDKLEDTSMSTIAKKLMVTQGTLTTSASKLIKKGYVERYRDSSDGRVVRLGLTEKADNIIEIHDKFHEEMIDSILKDLNVEDDLVLIKSLDRIMDYFKKNYENL
jgi:DNA-binding MarR family transcriptional regulator